MRVISPLSPVIIVCLLTARFASTEEVNITMQSCGDVNADEVINISDAVYLLNFLFLSGPPPACASPADEPAEGSCSRSAELLGGACQEDAIAEFRLASARCANLAPPYDAEECIRIARDALDERLALCDEQLEDRRELCAALGEEPYLPSFDPASFVDGIDHPYLRWAPGTTYVYEKQTAEGRERIELEVARQRREILGVACTAIFETESEDGDDEEESVDWFAQDAAGNVWHFGGRSFELEDGEIVGLAESWQAGVDGAQPGIVMLAAPTPGDVYRQEYSLAEAEDAARVLALGATAEVPHGAHTGCLLTEDFTPLEPDLREHKFYAPGIGLVLEIDLESGERVELVEIREED